MTTTTPLRERIPAYEVYSGLALPENCAYAVRLDGHAFRTFTAPFRAFDQRLADAMVATATYLLHATHATLAYTCSDEITLVFPLELDAETGAWVQKKNDFGRRVEKLTSLLAGRASACFALEIAQRTADDARLHQHVHVTLPHFDARILLMPEDPAAGNMELVNMVFWRVQDYEKNSISALAQEHFSPKQLQDKNSKQRLALLAERDVDWHALPMWAKHGTFVKRQVVETQPGVRRTREVSFTWEPVYKGAEAAKWMLSKYKE
jgi:tRNA(His) 5'-end guanylyltransferase